VAGWLSVSGNKIVNTSGQQVILKGVNIADPEQLNTKPWERPGVTARSIASAATDQFNAKVVRLPILPGDPAYPNEGFFSTTNGGETYFKNHIKPLVDELTAKGIYVIIDLHYVSDYDGLYSKVEAFWKFMAPKFATNPYVMYEIFNEPIYPDNWSTWKNTIAQPITTLIRTYAPKNLILVGGPYWSSHISGAVTEPVSGGNVVYVGHVYANQTSAMWDTRYGAVADKYPLFITEWGFESGGTEGGDITYGQNFSAWMAKRGLSWTVWSFDNLWGPRMFNQDWTLKPAPAGMGEFVRDLLAPK
jgi:endoglucanase